MQKIEGTLIGLEVHCQLTSLRTKLFCSCSADYRDKAPNTSLCPVCLGLPGSLPVLNKRAVELAVMVGMALNCETPSQTIFYRKNYFYPDMPKNFQISQYDRAGGVAIAHNGQVTFNVNRQPKTVHIRRIQLEEDPGKLYYPGTIDTSPYVLVDYNRAGIALLEIVTEPEFHSPQEARIFLQRLRSILEHLGVSDGTLEGSMRCDANISTNGGNRIEIKNISSFKEVERALNFEMTRQKDLVRKGVAIKMETRHWDDVRRITVALRTKEEEQDYRYFPEPDLVPVKLDEDFTKRIEVNMPELPDARRDRFVKEYAIPEYDAEVLTSDRALADFYEQCAAHYKNPKNISNWLMGDALQVLYSLELEINQSRVTPESFAEMLTLIDRGTISGKIAKKILWEMFKTGKSASVLVKEQGMVRISDVDELKEFVSRVFTENAEAVRDSLVDEKAVHFLVGKLMALTRGRADPELANQLIREELRKFAQQASLEKR